MGRISDRREGVGWVSGRGRSLAGSAAAYRGSLEVLRAAHPSGSDAVRLALIGCGGRGAGAAVQALRADPNARLVAMADAFPERLAVALKSMRQQPVGDRIDVPPNRQFVGLNAYQQAIAAGVDLVLLCTPPGFRPDHFEAAVAAGKHVFMEKPVATDAPGVRRVLAANARAKEQGLLVAVGHHLRHEEKHRALIREIHHGAIGDVKFLRAYFNSAGVWVRPRLPEQSELQYQVSNWYYFTWLSGDHIVEQHVHDLDICNWIMQSHPVEARGFGGRQVRKGPEYGEIFDHHSIEFTYANGTKLFSYCRHTPGCWNSFSEHAHGTRGTATMQGHGTTRLEVTGRPPKVWSRERDGHQTEHDVLFAALREGRDHNEADYGATSTMTAILGRMASYSGRNISWDEAIDSPRALAPQIDDWQSRPPVQPRADGTYACATPGVTRVL